MNINYIVWLIASSLFFATGEFLSKKFALSQNLVLVIMIIVAYSISVLLWLPAILQKNQLSIVGVMWPVLSLLITILIGTIIFGEKLSLFGVLGITFAIISTILLSLA